MKIFLDARNPRFNGSWTYMESLIPELVRLAPDDEFVVLYDRVHGPLGLPGVEERVAAGLHPGRWLAWNYTVLPRLLEREGVHVYHGLKQIHALRTEVKTVYTVHGATHFVYPQLHGRANVRYWRTVTTAAGRRTASRLIAVSEADKRSLAFWGRIPEERISVTRLAASERFQPVSDETLRRRVAERLGLRSPFVLFVGRVDPFKNVTGIIEAFRQALRVVDSEHDLVIAGAAEGAYYAQVRQRLREVGLEDRVTFTGHLREDLDVVFSLADVFLFPSLYEAFPLALLEAMKCGLPVITSRAGGCPEVVGDAGIKVDPLNPDEIADALVRVLSAPQLRAEMRQRSLDRAKSFSWDRCARQTLAVYREVYGQ